MRPRHPIPILAVALLCACGSSESAPQPTPTPEPASEPAPEPEAPAPRAAPEGEGGPEWDVTAWQAILDEHVTEDGGFRYARLAEDRAPLDAVVASVGDADLEGFSRDAELAFYINAYNALTVKSVLDAWPTESVMQVDGFFDEATHRVAGEEMTLNHLENEVIRSERFAEPRIHFAVNCASAGCPRLSRTAYTAENLEAQLAERARTFVRRTTRIDHEAGRVELSQIFEWYGSDFERLGGVRSFVASQLEADDAAEVRDEATEVAYFDYDWSINAL